MLPIKDDRMWLFSRIGLVSASIGALAPQVHAQTQPARIPVVCASTGHVFHIADAAGHYLALHFLPATDDRAARHISEFLRHAPETAGVDHVFIRADEPGRVKVWASQFKEHAGSVYIDTAGALANDLRISAHAFVVLVFDPSGNERVRLSASLPDEYVSWSMFADRFATRTASPTLKQYNLDAKRPVAVAGYDVVAYFTVSKAVKGKREIASVYRGIIYQFSTEDNRRLFAADPEKYLPTYGGWCASAMGAKGTKVEIDPTSFKVKNGRLFLFYQGTFSSALNDWNRHEREWEPAADANWKKLTGEEPTRPAK